jgi:hypothetical protein
VGIISSFDDRDTIRGVIDQELASPAAFALAVQSRASFLARGTEYESTVLRPYSQLTLLLHLEIEDADRELKARGLKGAYRWALSQG